MKIVLLDGFTANPGDLSWNALKALGDVTIYDRTEGSDNVIARAADAEIVLTNKVAITAEIMSKLPMLKYIGVLATGYNIIDIEEAKRRGIVVTNIPAYSSASVAQLVFAHILNIAQPVHEYNTAVHNGEWVACRDFSFMKSPLIELQGLKMGIVGFGEIGSSVASIAQSMGMEVITFSSKSENELPSGVRKCSMEQLFADSDILSLHCPLTAETRGLVDASKLALMKSNAIIINTSRGPIINEQDLADALNNNQIYAAGIDVLSSEPPKADNPLLTARNCYITPHIAWATCAARRRLLNILVENIKAYQAGQVINNVALA